MIKAVFLDDEPLALRQLEAYAARLPQLEVMASCTTASAVRSRLEQADVLFIDINMPDISGLDFVRSLERPPLVVFTTAYAEYALEGFRVNAVGYLLKPFGFDEFRQTVARVQHIVELEHPREAPEVLYFRTDYKTVSVRLADIRYIGSMSEYVKIYLVDQSQPLVVLYSLKRLVEELPPGKFLRIHRSYIVALAHIREASHTGVVLDNGTRLSVGEVYRPAFREYLNSRE